MPAVVLEREKIAQASQSRRLLVEHINGWTFYYDPAEITMDSRLRRSLGDFRSDDGETVFVVTTDDEGLIVY